MRAKNPKGEGARLRDEIVQSTIAMIDASDRPTVLTLRGIARAAHISAPSIYGHFPDLQAVLDAVLAHSFDQLRGSIAGAIEDVPDPAEALLAAGRAYVEFGWAHRARYRLMFDAGGYAPDAVQTYAMVESLIAQCADVGTGLSTDPHLDAWMLWAGLHGVATLQKPSREHLQRLGPLDRPAMLRTIIRRLARLPASGERTQTGQEDGTHPDDAVTTRP